MKVSTVSEMREMDRFAIQSFGIPEEVLMENAGEALYFVIRKEMEVRGKRFLVFCGAGNNGGDGFVVARKLLSNGGSVKIILLGGAESYRGAARLNLEIVQRLPIPIHPLSSIQEVLSDIAHCHAIVDAIFGTGLSREVGGIYRDAIEAINQAGKVVFSADIPSGVSGDSGKVMGVAVRADHTVTFGLPKIGNMLYPGYELCGNLFVTHISFPPSLFASETLLTEINLPKELPPRDRNAHKGSMGQALFVAGAAGYYGAPYFAAISFLKAGGGYARLAAPASIAPFVASKGSEIVLLPQKETAQGSISFENKEFLIELSAKMNMVILGPGLSLEKETQSLVRDLTRDIPVPLLLDGDGLTAVSKDMNLLRERQAPTILTPHPGEMSRMAGRSMKEIEDDRVETVRQAARDWNATVVLKGAHSLVGLPSGKVCINLTGNPGMASAGSGDVLAGTIAAMFGLGLDVNDAVLKGVFLHGWAGDLAARAKGEDGITAQDLVDFLPLALKMDREGCKGDNLRLRGALPII